MATWMHNGLRAVSAHICIGPECWLHCAQSTSCAHMLKLLIYFVAAAPACLQ